MKKSKHKRKSNIILIMNIFSLILLIASIFYLNYDLKTSQKEWKTHLDNGDIYDGNGTWLPTNFTKIEQNNSIIKCNSLC